VCAEIKAQRAPTQNIPESQLAIACAQTLILGEADSERVVNNETEGQKAH
jgi:hypothetical protein